VLRYLYTLQIIICISNNTEEFFGIVKRCLPLEYSYVLSSTLYREFIVFSIVIFMSLCKYTWARNNAAKRSPEPVKVAGILGISTFINVLSEKKETYINANLWLFQNLFYLAVHNQPFAVLTIAVNLSPRSVDDMATVFGPLRCNFLIAFCSSLILVIFSSVSNLKTNKSNINDHENTLIFKNY